MCVLARISASGHETWWPFCLADLLAPEIIVIRQEEIGRKATNQHSRHRKSNNKQGSKWLANGKRYMKKLD